MLPNPLTNFEIQKYYQNEPKFNGLYLRNSSSKIKDGAYIMSDEYESIRTHWTALYVNAKNVAYFDSFGVEHIPKEIRKLIRNKILQQLFIEYKHMIQYCVDIFVLDLL